MHPVIQSLPWGTFSAQISLIFFILGTSALITPIKLQGYANLDLLVNIFAGLLLFIFLFTDKGRQLERWEGLLFLAVYLA